MKTLGLIISMFFVPLWIYSQIPSKIDFQGVARDAQGNVMVQKPISIQVSILAKAPSGNAIYTERHKVTTDEYGLFALAIGSGQNNQGVFTEIQWDKGPHFVQVEIDPDGGNNYIDLGTLEMMAVPYAFYAQRVENADDADANPQNEIQQLELNGEVLSISDGNSVQLPDASSQNEIQQLALNGEVLSISNANKVQLPDASSTNELQELNFGQNNVLSISGGNAVQLPNVSSPWNLAGQSIYVESGRVGIGLTKPSDALSIYSENRATMNFLTSGSGSGQEDGFSVGLYKLSNSAVLWNYERGDIRFGTDDETRMYINQFGRVGIGTTAPGEKLEIASSDQDVGLRVKAAESNKSRLSLMQTTSSRNLGFTWEYDGSEDNFYLMAEGYQGYDGNKIMTIVPQGFIGINTNSPASNLSLNAREATSTLLTVTNDNHPQSRLLMGLHNGVPVLDFQDQPFSIRAEGRDALTVNHESGYVGINVSDPRVALEIDGRLLVSEETELLGSLSIGTGVQIEQIVEFRGTTENSGDFSTYSYPDGYNKNNTRVISAEIQHPGGSWLGIATGSSLDRIRVALLDTAIRIFHPPLNDYQNRPFRLLLMRVAN